MSFSLPPVVKLAERLRIEIEQAVRRFPRYHKYTTGTDLRAQMKRVVALAHRAWRDRRRQGDWITQLLWAVDELKLELQLGRDVHAFASARQFEMLARMASDPREGADLYTFAQFGCVNHSTRPVFDLAGF